MDWSFLLYTAGLIFLWYFSCINLCNISVYSWMLREPQQTWTNGFGPFFSSYRGFFRPETHKNAWGWTFKACRSQDVYHNWLLLMWLKSAIVLTKHHSRKFVPKQTKPHHEACCSCSLAPPHLTIVLSQQGLKEHNCCWPETQPFFPLSHPLVEALRCKRGPNKTHAQTLTANGHTSYFREPAQILQNHSKDDFCTKHHRMVTY